MCNKHDYRIYKYTQCIKYYHNNPYDTRADVTLFYWSVTGVVILLSDDTKQTTIKLNIFQKTLYNWVKKSNNP